MMFSFFKDAVKTVFRGGTAYRFWMATLAGLIVVGLYAYGHQFEHGLGVTGMSDHVSWGLYISNFTFLVGLAAAAVMIVMPAYVMNDVDFSRAVLVGEGVAVAALVMCLCFVTADMGGPTRLWHMLPGIGLFNFPQSLLAWDVIVLNGYLALNLLIPFYVLYMHYTRRQPNRSIYVPFVLLSVFWAFGIHLVTAFLYAGLTARPFWNSALLGPRFLASAFAAGPAFIVVALTVIRRFTRYGIRDAAIDKLALIVTVAAQVNLIMLASELFKEFYWPTHHSLSAQYLFFGLHDHAALRPWIWTGIGLNALATIVLTIHPLRRDHRVLSPTCVVLFFAIWIEKGVGLVIPGFIPSPLGELVEYAPTAVELAVTVGILGLGLAVFTVLAKIAVAVETGEIRAPE